MSRLRSRRVLAFLLVVVGAWLWLGRMWRLTYDGSTQPTLFIVATLRIDGYGGNIEERAQRMIANWCLNAAAAQQEHRIELVIVEWAFEPSHMWRVVDAIDLNLCHRRLSRPMRLRVLTIDEEVVSRRLLKDSLPVEYLEYWAKNVAIRRISEATGASLSDFILITNPDALLPPATFDELLEAVGSLAAHQHHSCSFIRAHLLNYDYRREAIILNDTTVVEVSGAWRRPWREGDDDAEALDALKTFHLPREVEKQIRPPYPSQLLYASAGDFLGATARQWQLVGGFVEGEGNEGYDYLQLDRFSQTLGCSQHLLANPILHQYHKVARAHRVSNPPPLSSAFVDLNQWGMKQFNNEIKEEVVDLHKI